MWRNEDIEELYKECKCLQARMTGSWSSIDREQISRTFSNLRILGKTKSALQFLFRKTDEGILKLDDHIPCNEGRSCTVCELLQELHSAGKDPDPESLMSSSCQDSLPSDPILFEALDGARIQQVAHQCNGYAGPTGLDAHAWRRMCTSFKQASWDLCSAIAGVTRCICTKSVDPEGLSTLVARHLIPVNKCPGVRPIGVGEVLRRRIGKAR